MKQARVHLFAARERRISAFGRPGDTDMSILAALVERAGLLRGRGVNHEGEPFDGTLEIVPVLRGRGVTLHYIATGLDGKALHEEFALLAPADDGQLCLWPVMEELPVVLPHRSTGADAAGVSEVFANAARDAVDQFREEVTIECDAEGGVLYAHAWALPGGEFAPRSHCALNPEPTPATTIEI